MTFLNGTQIESYTYHVYFGKSWISRPQNNTKIYSHTFQNAVFSPTPLEKMKDNDRAFRRWLRKSNRRKKDEDRLDREKERLRRIELRREARAQKALAAIRAAQDVALKNRTFVF